VTTTRQRVPALLCTYMSLVNAFDLGDQRSIHSSGMAAMAPAMGNHPIRSIVSAACFKRDIM